MSFSYLHNCWPNAKIRNQYILNSPSDKMCYIDGVCTNIYKCFVKYKHFCIWLLCTKTHLYAFISTQLHTYIKHGVEYIHVDIRDYSFSQIMNIISNNFYYRSKLRKINTIFFERMQRKKSPLFWKQGNEVNTNHIEYMNTYIIEANRLCSLWNHWETLLWTFEMNRNLFKLSGNVKADRLHEEA